MKPDLSVIVQTSPAREEQLFFCLSMLKRQSLDNFEVLVIDDGSQYGEKTAESFFELNLNYLWRENDCCLSRSRNIGANSSQSPYLVYIDSDILLHPRALQHYLDYLNQRKNTLICGYYGNDRSKIAPSLWFSDLMVNWYDRRFFFDDVNSFVIEKELMKKPHLYAFGGNFAIEKEFYLKLNGFDENFIGWGCEDIDFANRVLLGNGSIHFSLDVWGEHQCHNTNERFHQVSSKEEVVKVKEAKVANLLHSSLKNRVIMAKEREALQKATFEHYKPNNKYFEEKTDFQMTRAITKDNT